MAVALTNPSNLIQFANPQPQDGVAFDQALSRVKWSRSGGSQGYSFDSIVWSVTSGSLPAGMSLGGDFTSVTYFYTHLQGTPSESGSFTITLQCSVDWTETSLGFNGTGNTTESFSITFTVDAATSTVTHPTDNGDGTGTNASGDSVDIIIIPSTYFDVNRSYPVNEQMTPHVHGTSPRTGTSFSFSLASDIGLTVSTGITGLPTGMSYAMTPANGVGSWNSKPSISITGTPTVVGVFNAVMSITYTTTFAGTTISSTTSDDINLNFTVTAAQVTEVDSIVTGYQVNGADLNTILAGRSGLTARANVGLQANGTDLSQLFANVSDGSSPTTTGYTINGADLSTLFAAKGTL